MVVSRSGKERLLRRRAVMTSEGPDMAGGGGQQVGAEQDYAGDSPPQSEVIFN